MSEIQPEELAEIRNIQMLIGRNVLIFQNIEQILKLINHFGKGRNNFTNLSKRKEKIDQFSFGRLTDKKRLKEIDSSLKYESNKEIIFSYDFLPDDKNFNDAVKFLNSKNEDRNLMVHHISQRWQFDNADHREEAKNWLTNLYESVFEQRKILVDTLYLITQRYDEYFKDVNSDAFDVAIDQIKKIKAEEPNVDIILRYSKLF